MKYNEIGIIAKAHSFRGDVRIKSYTDFGKERFKVGSILYYLDKDEYKPLKVTKKNGSKGSEILHFEGYDSDTSLYPLLGKKLYAEKDYSLLKGNDKHFLSDYIGMNISQFGEIKGKVISIIELPQCHHLNIKCTDNIERFVPILDEYIKDVTDDTIYLNEIEDLL